MPSDRVTIDDEFWAPRRATIRERTIPHQYEHLRTGGQLEALKLNWKPGDPGEPHIFWESDVAKWIEAASYVLGRRFDPALDRRIDDAIALLENAQQPDGYLNVYFTLVRPGRRFTDLRDAHELYGAGHLIEAAVAHHAATGKTSLLAIVRRYVDLIDREFGPGGIAEGGYDGHEEIELALIKLFRATGDRRYLDLSLRFINNRGTQPYFFDAERGRRGDEGWAGEHVAFLARPQQPTPYREYSQAHVPVREQTEVVGHAVRAMYLYTAMADLARELDDGSLRRACEQLWEDLISCKLYITGGLGSEETLESFGAPYDLPDADAYAETCAAIGLVFWSQRMALLTGASRYADVMERALYNGVLSGMSADGTSFFYRNPLASRGGVQRSPWFGTACCPPNLARVLSSLEQYVYAADEHALTINLFVGGSVSLEVDGQEVKATVRTEYPWDGDIRVDLESSEEFDLALRVRIPGWFTGAPTLEVNGEPVSPELSQGYAVLARHWKPGDQIQVTFPMPVTRVYADQRVRSTHGKVALQRGPIIYCVEEIDNDTVSGLRLPRESELQATRSSAGDVARITAAGEFETLTAPQLYSAAAPQVRQQQITAVPYFSWANRGAGSMAVWIRE